MARNATEAFLEHYGTRGAELIINKIVDDWAELEINSDPSNPLMPAVQEIRNLLLPRLHAMLCHQANGAPVNDLSGIHRAVEG